MPANFFKVTAQDIANWPPPQYDNPPDQRKWLPAFAIAWQAVSTVLAFGRFYVRARRQAGTFGFDDSLIFIAWISSVAFTIVACLGGYLYGVNRHTWDVPPDLYVWAALTGWLAQVFFLFSTFGTKLSVLLFYRRMVKDTVSRAWLYTIWVFIAITVTAYIAMFVTYMNICTPLEAYWEAYNLLHPFQREYYCINGQSLDLAIGVLMGVSDVWSVVIPCMMLRHYNLDLSTRQKIGLNIVFCLGLLATGAGIARTYYLWQIDHTPDVIWVGFNLYICSIIECHLGIICACLPSLRAFFRYHFGDPTRRTYGSGRRSAQEDSAKRESRRWSKRNTKDTWHTEISTVRGTRDVALLSPAYKHSAHISLWPKASNEDMS